MQISISGCRNLNTEPTSVQIDEKTKNTNFNKLVTFLKFPAFHFFILLRSGPGSHFTKENCKGNVNISKIDIFVQGPAGCLAGMVSEFRSPAD